MSTQSRVLIIGAGVSGIAAATKLIENGFSDIKILEAENRIGGRVCSVDFGGSVVDLGGQWVHGEEGNIVYQMVQGLDMLSPSYNTYEDMTYYLSDGNEVDKHITDRLHKIGMDIMGDEEAALAHPGPFGTYFIKRYSEEVLKEFGGNKEVLKMAKYLENWFHKFFTCLDPSKTWYDVSTSGAFAFKPCAGNQHLNWRDKGFRTFLDVMMKKLPDITKQLPLNDKIILNKEVTKVVWDDATSNETGVTVHCADGSTYNADHVIVTVSVGVLKKFHQQLFVPELPSYKVNCIENITLGTVNKILIKFPTKWWPNDLKGFSLLWTNVDSINLINECPEFGPVDDNGRCWLEDVFGFYVIDSHPRVLLAWVVGKMAAEVELLSDEAVMSSCMYLLRKFVGHKYDIPEADGVLRSTWNSNPHFCGSYVYVGIDQEKNKATADDLARPVVSKSGKETLYFAGEATSATKYSTVHGAVETGYREADRIIDLYKKTEHRKVVIVGAGMAGLGAAQKLAELNFTDFLILEAQDHPGGRIKTITVDGVRLDLGAQWLHGKNNMLYELASKHDLLSHDTSEEGLGLFVRDDGVILDEFLVKQVDWEIGKILEECQTFINKSEFPGSVEEFLEQKFSEYLDSCSDSAEKRQMKLELFNWHVRFQIVDNSCRNLKRVSAKSWGTYICLDDTAHYNLKNGYKSLVDVIIGDIPENNILLKTELTKVEYNEFGILLTCNDRKISCDHLVLTPSLGFLKEFHNFTPTLPKSIRKSIDEMGFYGIGKIILFFSENWWGELKGLQFVWRSDSVLEEEKKWIRHLTGFEVIHNHPNALLGWVGGSAVETVELLDEEEIGRVCVDVLRKFLMNYDIPQAIKVIRSKWLSDPWIKGSYCHITPECDRSGLGIDKLSEPVYVDGVPRILLAGEAVHSSHYSTTHGAYESGQQQAVFLHKYITKQNGCSNK